MMQVVAVVCMLANPVQCGVVVLSAPMPQEQCIAKARETAPEMFAPSNLPWRVMAIACREVRGIKA